MWHQTIGYRDYRPPYLPEFFGAAAERLQLSGREALLDLGCGMGDVALGLARHVAGVTGIDADLLSLQVMESRARRAGIAIRTVHARVEEAPETLGPFDLVTLGKAYSFMDPRPTHARIDRWLRPDGRVMICWPVEMDTEIPAWTRLFFLVLARWTRDERFKHHLPDPASYLAGSAFVAADRIDVFGSRTVTLDDVINRAFGYPGTTRPALGADADRLSADLRKVLGRFFAHGPITETLHTIGMIFRRRGAP